MTLTFPTLPWPTKYVQWRYVGETEWRDYHPLTIPWDVDTVEMRMLPRPTRP